MKVEITSYVQTLPIIAVKNKVKMGKLLLQSQTPLLPTL